MIRIYLQKFNILKLSNNDLVIGEILDSSESNITLGKPYTVRKTPEGPQLLPYELELLLEPMDDIIIRTYDVMWNKALKDFPVIEQQYSAATTGIELDVKESIIL